MLTFENTKTKKAKRRLLRIIKERFFVRFHMALIILACLATGLLSTKIMLMSHIDSMVVRYPLAVLAAYVVFFIGVRIWLLYANQDNWCYTDNDGTTIRSPQHPNNATRRPRQQDPAQDNLNKRASETNGGSYFDIASPFDALDAVEFLGDSADSVASGAETAGGILDGVDAVADVDGPLIMLAGVIIAVIIALLLGSAVYLIYEAPTILSEAAFEFLLAAGLMKPIRRIDNPGWVGSVLKATALPFVITVCVSVVFAWVANYYAPEATKLSDVFIYLSNAQY